MSSIILGKYIFKILELSSIQGFVLTSINQTLKSSSIMKSYPKSSKHDFLLEGSIILRVAKDDLTIKE
jgi:hypothetical protein